MQAIKTKRSEEKKPRYFYINPGVPPDSKELASAWAFYFRKYNATQKND